MTDLSAYSAISTKLRSMKSKLLTDNDYSALANLKTVSEATEYLKQKPAYRTILSVADESSLHRGTLEQLLFYASYRDFAKLYRFSNMKLRSYLDMHFLYYEATFIKTNLRNIFDHRNIDFDLSFFMDFFQEHTKIDLQKLNTAKTILDLLESLKNTGFYSALIHLYDKPEATLLDYEMTVDLYVFSRQWKQINKSFQGKDLEILTKSYGSKFDLLNLLWIYRSKKYYRLSTGEIYNLIIPIHYRLKRQTIRAIIEASSLDEWSVMIQKSYYGKKFPQLLSSPEDYTLEQIYYQQLSALHLYQFRIYPFSIASLNSYLYLKSLEYEKLTTILECIRYGLDTSKILIYIHKYEPEVITSD